MPQPVSGNRFTVRGLVYTMPWFAGYDFFSGGSRQRLGAVMRLNSPIDIINRKYYYFRKSARSERKNVGECNE
jgi:hypothetical protein